MVYIYIYILSKKQEIRVVECLTINLYKQKNWFFIVYIITRCENIDQNSNFVIWLKEKDNIDQNSNFVI
jgi:hypothetical protein